MAERSGSTKPPPPTEDAVVVPRTTSRDFGSDTSEHIRVQLDELKGQVTGLAQKQDTHNTKLDQAIKVDKEDHALMRVDNSDTRDAIDGVRKQVDGTQITLNVMANALGLQQRVETARAQAQIEDEVDRKKRQRALLYSWLERIGVGVIAAVFALLAAGHRC